MIRRLLLLALVALHCPSVFMEEDPLIDWRNYVPWARDNMLKDDFGKHISLRIVQNNWIPKGFDVPEGSALPRFPGTANMALKIFMDNTMYGYTELPLETALQLFTKDSGYRDDNESIFIIHTISNNARSDSVRNVITALQLRKLIMKKYNVFVFNMPGLNESMEKTVAKSVYGWKGNLKILSKTLGDFFNSAIKQNLITLDQIHLLGFCYSAQLSGFLGRYISSTNYNKKIKSITALDPISLGLFGVFNKVISKNDAQLVYVYHTNSIALGTIYRRATADFNFNSGYMQPGCYTSPEINCSHWRVVTVFYQVILYPQLWVARKCPTWLLFKSCLCNMRATTSITFPPQPGARGSYYLNTLPHKPYGYGRSGANCYAMNRREKAMELTSSIAN